MAEDSLSIDVSPTSISNEGRFSSKKPLIIGVVMITIFLFGLMYAADQREGNVAEKEAEKEIVATADNSRISKLLNSLKDNKIDENSEESLADLTKDEPLESERLNAPENVKLSDAEIRYKRLRKMRQDRYEDAIYGKMAISDSDSMSMSDGLLDFGSAPKGSVANKKLNSSGIVEKYLENYKAVNEKGTSSKTNVLDREHEDGYLQYTKKKLLSPYELKIGSMIPAVLISGMNSEVQGKIVAQVRENIYDTATGNYLLIPQGTKIVGEYDSNPKYGTERLLVAFNRLIFPDGQSLNLGAMNGIDGAGFAGFSDQVNHHYFKIFGSAFLLSILGGEITFEDGQIKMNSGNSLTQQQTLMQQTAAQMISKNLNIAPTIEIRNGYRFNIFVTKDMILERLNR